MELELFGQAMAMGIGTAVIFALAAIGIMMFVVSPAVSIAFVALNALLAVGGFTYGFVRYGGLRETCLLIGMIFTELKEEIQKAEN